MRKVRLQTTTKKDYILDTSDFSFLLLESTMYMIFSTDYRVHQESFRPFIVPDRSYSVYGRSQMVISRFKRTKRSCNHTYPIEIIIYNSQMIENHISIWSKLSKVFKNRKILK